MRGRGAVVDTPLSSTVLDGSPYQTKSDQRISLAYGFAFSTGLTLGDKATSEGKDSFDIAPQVADVVLTNVKARGGIR
jgi:hypothetical protein